MIMAITRSGIVLMLMEIYFEFFGVYSSSEVDKTRQSIQNFFCKILFVEAGECRDAFCVVAFLGALLTVYRDTTSATLRDSLLVVQVGKNGERSPCSSGCQQCGECGGQGDFRLHG